MKKSRSTEATTRASGSRGRKAVAFLKKNVYYLIMILCLAAIAVMVTLSVMNKQQADTPVIDTPVVETPIVDPITETPVDNKPVENPEDKAPEAVAPPIVFSIPVDASASVIKGYSMDALVFSSTLKQYQVHNGIDYGGAEGSYVYSCYGGTVEKVSYDILNGYSIRVKHNDTLTSVYSSLKETNVNEGQAVAKGERIGSIGVSATAEMTDGPHVHFSVLSAGKYIDPATYFADNADK